MPAALVFLRVLLLLVVVGVLSSAAGFVVGAFVGQEVERSVWDCNCDDPGLWGLLYGAALGPALLTPLSVYLVNRRRGNLLVSLVVSAGIAAVAIVLLHQGVGARSSLGIFVILAPAVVQAISTGLIGACTSKRLLD
jgi:hypothetical protein